MTENSSDSIKQTIQEVIISMMDRLMNSVLAKDPFIKEKHWAARPLYATLVPDEIFKQAHFERRFVTRFGNAWQHLAVLAAKHGLGHAEVEYHNTGERSARPTQSDC